jgi:hypothetical protein
MATLDAHYMEDPCNDSRWMVDYLARDGILINCDRVRNLMRGSAPSSGVTQEVL